MNSHIILYYQYTPVSDPKALMLSQRAICERLGLKGRIIVATEGINGTLEGTEKAIVEYCKDLTSDPRFATINIKKSIGSGDSFPKLKVKVRDEIVSAKLGEEDVKPWETTGIHLSAEELQKWIDEGKEFEIVDMRNNYEYKVGHFEGSLNPELGNFRDLPNAISALKEKVGNKPVLTVCTGGVRCEKASAYLLKKGFENVYQLENGIVTYMEKFPNKAFKGKLYVFDERIAMDFDDPSKHEVVGKCDICKAPTEHYVNCKNPECNAHFLVCNECIEEQGVFCSAECREYLEVGFPSRKV